MTVLTQDRPREYELGNVNEFSLAGGVVYEGAAVGDNGEGKARPLVAGDPFLGFCERSQFHTARVLRRGLIQLPVTGVVSASLGAPVYAVDDDTFTLSADKNSLIGKVYRVIANDLAMVSFGY